MSLEDSLRHICCRVAFITVKFVPLPRQVLYCKLLDHVA